MLTINPLSIIVHGIALNITVETYAGNVDFGVLACRKAAPDVREIAEGIVTAYHEARAEAKGATTAKESAKKAAKSAAKPGLKLPAAKVAVVKVAAAKAAAAKVVATKATTKKATAGARGKSVASKSS
jgi:diacylglycerol O-acyltransferase / wax synthase